ncbi:hypothetical protein RRG08_050930 [Elysia crispata]|uniref:Uncharacterized protein n=1 Tax=Elysia crispata TaxID=231223 RepID=A0AAE0YQ95_9GAST|nr:hypothetical protein RRG08_050930 [Elysia crispata]
MASGSPSRGITSQETLTSLLSKEQNRAQWILPENQSQNFKVCTDDFGAISNSAATKRYGRVCVGNNGTSDAQEGT